MRSLAFFLMVSFPISTLANEFEIFTLGKAPKVESNATVYVVDQGDQLLKSINQTMLASGITNEEQGKQYATPELSNALVNQVKGLIQSGKYQLKYFPAVVIDGRYVIYGTTDISLFEKMKP